MWNFPEPPTLLYHANCHDGFCSAWIARARWPGCTLIACEHGGSPPPLAGRHVVFADFAYRRAAMEKIRKEAASLTVVDHHKSAQADLGDFPGCFFDMQRSGAGLLWDLVFAGRPRPWLVDYVEDRDLWRWTQPDSQAVGAALLTLPYDLDAWTAVSLRRPEELIPMGRAVQAYGERLVERARRRAHRIRIAGHDVPCVATPVLQSELGSVLSVGEPFSATYEMLPDGSREFSLRSQPGGLDVAEIARRFGGGGHATAAGFRVAPGASLD